MKKLFVLMVMALIPMGVFAQEQSAVSEQPSSVSEQQSAVSEQPSAVSEQPAENNTFGGWLFAELNHDFRNGMYVTGFFEHDNYQFRRLECNYFRLSVGYKPLPWLKAGVNYVPVCLPGGWLHYGEVDVMCTLKSGNFKVSIRERYRHGFTNGINELRSRLKVAYSISEKWGVYLAPEVFTWGTEWKRTRHYCACTYEITKWMQAEAFYLYYAFRNVPAEHVLGLGLNFDL